MTTTVIEDRLVGQVQHRLRPETNDRVVECRCLVRSGDNLPVAELVETADRELLSASDQDGGRDLVTVRDHLVEGGMDNGRVMLPVDDDQVPDEVLLERVGRRSARVTLCH